LGKWKPQSLGQDTQYPKTEKKRVFFFFRKSNEGKGTRRKKSKYKFGIGFEEKDRNINTPTFVGYDSLGVGAPVGRINIFGIYSTFFLKEHPSVNRALPPVGVQRTDPHPAQ